MSANRLHKAVWVRRLDPATLWITGFCALAAALGGPRIAAAEKRAGSALIIRATRGSECRIGRAFQRSLHSILPDVHLRRRGAPAGADLLVVLTIDGARLQLAIEDSQGRQVLSRRLERRRGDRCADMADAAAFVVERFLTDLAWSGLSPDIELATEPPPPPPLPVTSIAPRLWGTHLGALGPLAGPLVPAPPDVSPSRGGRRRARWRGYAQLGLAVALTELSEPGVSVAVSALAHSGWRAQVRVQLYPGLGSDVRRGARTLGVARTSRIGFSVAAGRCLGRRWFGCLSAVAGAQWARVGAAGIDLYRETAAAATRPTAGVQASAGRALGRGFRIRLELDALASPGQTAFVIEGVEQPVYVTPGIDVTAALVLGRRFF